MYLSKYFCTTEYFQEIISLFYLLIPSIIPLSKCNFFKHTFLGKFDVLKFKSMWYGYF